MTTTLEALRRANALANRWGRAWPGYGRGWATHVRLEEAGPDAPYVAFRMQPDYGGIGTDTSFAASFLDDDTGFEEAARAWWAAKQAADKARYDEEKQLEALPEVQAYLKLKGYHPYGSWYAPLRLS